jgi:hypothetical protein
MILFVTCEDGNEERISLSRATFPQDTGTENEEEIKQKLNLQLELHLHATILLIELILLSTCCS